MDINKQSIIIGCNYHLKWQSNPSMRFVLGDILGEKAMLYTRKTKKVFWTNISDLIFIMSNHNIKKAIKIINDQKKESTRV